ncbi:uncharacterized protein L201_003912 [Kwoniella dendrophila CBS 6074]|uniref:SUN domain-containing protein n=1 Tax=Kwoniella dendrophila CBS 6074 TaxID=1295534 RepID=A0AAX4JWU7_9TREE
MFRNHYYHNQLSPSTSPSSPPRSSTPELDRGMNGRASTVTSLYSDDPTEVPPLHNHYGDGIVKEGRLIDYDDSPEQEEEEEEEAKNPGDKLRELLNQMRQAVEYTKPPPSLQQSVTIPQQEERRITRRRDWRKSLYNSHNHMDQEDEAGPSSSSREGSPERRRYNHVEADDEEEEEEQESPPTPPPRIGNPYAARRFDRRSSPNLGQPARMPSRAAVLLNSTSRSPPISEPQEPEIKSPPTKLEAFLASSTTSLPPPAAFHAESSTSSRLNNSLSRSLSRRNSGSSTSSSRKGKDRSISPLPILPLSPHDQPQMIVRPSSRLKRSRQTPTSPTPEIPLTSTESYTHKASRTRRMPQTPRRISVDSAPEDISAFARNAADLEVRGEVELDLDEGLSGIGWEESSQSIIEEQEEQNINPMSRSSDLRESLSRSPQRGERSSTLKPRSPSPLLEKQGSTLRDSRNPYQPSSRQHSHNHNHDNQAYSSSPPIKRPTRSPSPPLPALPEPDNSAISDISEIDTYSSRRATLFRSTSRSASTSTSRSTINKSGSQTPTNTSYGTAIGQRSRISNRASVERDQEEFMQDENSVLHKKSTPQNRYLPSPAVEDDISTAKYRQSPKESSPPSPKKTHETSMQSSLKRYTPPRTVEDIQIPSQEPIQVNLALRTSTHIQSASTPLKSNSAVNPNLSTMPTPKPPGAWQSTPKGKVRFIPSPLGKSSPIKPELNSFTQIEEEGVSIHRLRVSPRRSPKSKVQSKTKDEEEVGNSSFLGRLAESISSPLKRSRISIPPKSTTFTSQKPSLEHAKSATIAAEQKLILTQAQWLEALSAINAAANAASPSNVNVTNAVKKGWSWSTWLLWALVEIVVIWSVFRVTIDYATSLTHISTLDPSHPLALPFRQATSSQTWGTNGPFGLKNPLNLNIPIPSALQTLVGTTTNSHSNFFDLIESWGLWHTFTPSIGGTGNKILGGVPT